MVEVEIDTMDAGRSWKIAADLIVCPPATMIRHAIAPRSSTFNWPDLLAYAVGIASAALLEHYFRTRRLIRH
jgi:hypothetical protein